MNLSVQRWFNTVLAIQPEALTGLLALSGIKLGLNGMEVAAPEALAPRDRSKSTNPGYEVVGGVAVIPIVGPLVHRLDAYAWYFGLPTYRGIESKLAKALSDDKVESILFEIDSPGGQISGLAPLGQMIYEARGQKPIWAVAADQATSAAYWLGSAASRFYAPPLGYVGSIGVWVLHVDWSRFNDGMGLTYTYVHSGKHKVDGHPDAPLPPKVKKRWQDLMDMSRAEFAEAVARNRNLPVQAVLDTEARVFTGEEALGLGLIDGLATVNEVLEMMAGEIDSDGQPVSGEVSADTYTGARAAVSPEHQPKEADMPDNDKEMRSEAAAETPAPETDTGQAQDQTVQATEQPQPSADEKARIKAILGCEEAQGRDKLARHLALETDMSAEAAKGVLAAAPKEQADNKPAGTGFEEAMTQVENPNVGVDGLDPDDNTPSLAEGMKILVEARGEGRA